MFLLGRNSQELFKHPLFFISIKGVQTSYTKYVNKQKEGLDHTQLMDDGLSSCCTDLSLCFSVLF